MSTGTTPLIPVLGKMNKSNIAPFRATSVI